MSRLEVQESRVARFTAGMTLAEIAAEDGVTRQAVCKALAKAGVDRYDGGQCHRTLVKEERRAEDRQEQSRRMYGVPWTPENAERIKRMRAAGLCRPYSQYKKDSQRSGPRPVLNIFEWANQRAQQALGAIELPAWCK